MPLKTQAALMTYPVTPCGKPALPPSPGPNNPTKPPEGPSRSTFPHVREPVEVLR